MASSQYLKCSGKVSLVAPPTTIRPEVGSCREEHAPRSGTSQPKFFLVVGQGVPEDCSSLGGPKSNSLRYYPAYSSYIRLKECLQLVVELLLRTMDLVMDTKVYIEESLEDIQEGSMLDPQERDLYGMGLPTMNAFGKVRPPH